MNETRKKLPRSQAIRISLSVAASLTFASWASAVTVDLAPSKDNTLIQSPVGNSNGAGDGVYAGRVGSLGTGTRRRGLIAFDLSSIPPASTINSVTLRLEMIMAPNAIGRTVTLHRVSADWGEAGSSGAGGTGALAQSGDATWLFRFFNSQAWTTAGGDFAAVPSASQVVADLGPYDWTGPDLVADVQFWVDNAASNFGWLVRGEEATTSTVKKFYSSEGLTPPRLTVDYSGPTDVASGPGAEAVWFAPPWPAPASRVVNLSYTLPRAARVSLVIHDAMGRVVRRLTSGVAETAGRHATVWDGRTDSGTQAASGVYLASLVVDEETHLRRIPLVR